MFCIIYIVDKIEDGVDLKEKWQVLVKCIIFSLLQDYMIYVNR